MINSIEHVETHSTSHPIHKFLSYNKLSPSYKFFALSVSIVLEPISFAKAVAIPEWRSAMDSELQALEDGLLLAYPLANIMLIVSGYTK